MAETHSFDCFAKFEKTFFVPSISLKLAFCNTALHEALLQHAKIPILALYCADGDLRFYYRYFQHLCSNELAPIVPPLAFPSRQTRSSTYLFHCSNPKTHNHLFLPIFYPRNVYSLELLVCLWFPLFTKSNETLASCFFEYKKSLL